MYPEPISLRQCLVRALWLGQAPWACAKSKLQPGQRVSEPAPGVGHRPWREYRNEEIGAGLSKKMGKKLGVGTILEQRRSFRKGNMPPTVYFSKMRCVLILFFPLEILRIYRNTLYSSEFRILFLSSASLFLSPWGMGISVIYRCLCLILWSSRLPCFVFVFCLLFLKHRFSAIKFTHCIPSLALKKTCFPRDWPKSL